MDTAHDRVFVSGDVAQDVVVVADLQGRVTDVLHGLPGATGMALSPDGDTLYVALARLPGLARVDTGDLSVRTTRTATGSCPRSVAWSADLVWYASPCDYDGGLGAWSPATGANHTGVLRHFGTPPLLASPRRPNELVGGDGFDLARLVVTGGDHPTARVVSTSENDGSAAVSLALTPNGRRLVVASGSPYYHRVLDADDLHLVDSYDTGPYPNAVAITGDGTVAAGIAANDPDVSLYHQGEDHPYKSFVVDGGEGDIDGDGSGDRTGVRRLTNDGLAWGDDRLYAVTSANYLSGEEENRLLVLTPGGTEPPRIRSDQPTYDAGDDAAIRVATHDFASHRLVRLFASTDNNRSEVAHGELNDAGVFSAFVPVTRTTTFEAELDGDPALSAELVVPVTARVDEALTGGKRVYGRYTYREGQSAQARASFAPARDDICMRFRTELKAKDSWQFSRLSPCLATDEAGRVTWTARHHYVAGSHVRVRAEWEGDDQNAAAVSPWLDATFVR